MAEITLKEYLDKNSDRLVNEAALEPLLKPISRVWKPKLGDTYWTVPEFGDMLDYVWDGGFEDAAAYSTGNCFPTLDAAEFEWERRKVVTELQRLAEEAGGVDWNNRDSDKHVIMYDHDAKRMSFGTNHSLRGVGAIYFPTLASAGEAVVKIGEARIKRFLFGVTE